MPSVCSKVVKSTGATPNFSKFRVKFPDVAIHCENGTKIIKASSIVLAEVSPFFASLLSFQSGEVKFSELTLSEVEKLLDFLYDGSVSFDTQHSFDHFVANARKLQIRRLPNFEIRGSGVAPEALSAEASSGGSLPPAKRIKIEEPLNQELAKEILQALCNPGVDHAAVFPLTLGSIYKSFGYQVTPEQIGDALGLIHEAEREKAVARDKIYVKKKWIADLSIGI